MPENQVHEVTRSKNQEPGSLVLHKARVVSETATSNPRPDECNPDFTEMGNLHKSNAVPADGNPVSALGSIEMVVDIMEMGNASNPDLVGKRIVEIYEKMTDTVHWVEELECRAISSRTLEDEAAGQGEGIAVLIPELATVNNLNISPKSG